MEGVSGKCMIKVDEIGYRHQYNANSERISKSHSQPAFTGKPSVSQIPSTALRDAVEALLPRSVRALKKLGSHGGEIQNIIINAIGTGIVAPIFIKYNFLSDSDEDTRTYSAWRQPISAVLAVATQAGLTAPFYKIFDSWANKGVFGEELSKTLFMDNYYVEKLMKRQYPNATKNQIKQYAANFKKQQKESLIKDLKEQSTVNYRLADGSSRKISGTEYRNLLEETIDNLAKADLDSMKEIEQTVKRRTIRSQYYRTHNQQANEILTELRKKIKKAGSISEINSYISEQINKLRKDKNSSEMIAILGEIQNRSKKSNGRKTAQTFTSVKQALNDKVNKMLEHVKKYSKVNSDAEVSKLVAASVEKEINALKESQKFYETLKRSITEQSKIKDLQAQITAQKNLLNIEQSSLNKDFAREVAEQLISRTNAHMKCYKQIVGVFVSLAILPFTCTLLNWIYPRFMDVFFPNLSNKKHQNESSKLVAQAPKKAEVA